MTLNPDDLLGRHMGPYTLDRLLGQGGFAWVFAAHDDSGKPAAVKVLKPRYAGDTQFERRFRNESQVASELNHPHIVETRRVGQAEGTTYFAMDLYPDSLGSLLEREGPLPEARVLQLAIDIAEALAFAHARDVVHRDIKVDNILLRADGAAVLADFGIARAVTGYVTATGVNMTIGTPHYVSPEQAQGRPLDGRSDLYALGVTLYKALTGDVPFRSTDWFELARMHVEDQPVPPTERRPEISHRFERVVLRCLAKHPDDRYPSAAQLLDLLKEIQAGTRATTEITAPREAGRLQGIGVRGTGGWRWMWVVGGIVLVAAVVAAFVFLARR